MRKRRAQEILQSLGLLQIHLIQDWGSFAKANYLETLGRRGSNVRYSSLHLDVYRVITFERRDRGVLQSSAAYKLLATMENVPPFCNTRDR
mmetsp:Transcript_26930/g.65391  ORF Transcript_26930/g.65391 Transcript_26930/m.65391 type:complete len:91 (+) Transcript_26930:1041-1313(+)